MDRPYNFEHFRTTNFIVDGVKTLRRVGVRAGAPAPDFELTEVDGTPWRLSAHLDRPVLLHFASFT